VIFIIVTLLQFRYSDTMFKKLLLAAVAVLATNFLTSAAIARVQLLVPAYFYPSFQGSDWDRMTAAVRSGVPVTAIMNPASGPGTATNSDYVMAVNSFRAAGGKVLGYVPSGYIGQAVNAGSSCQPASGSTYATSDVVACAGLYQSLYSVDGIFVDEMGAPVGGAPEASILSFYQTVYDGIKSVNAAWTVFGNPGVVAPEGLLRTGATGGADSLVTFENFGTLYGAATPPAYAQNYAADRFGNILIETDPAFDFDAALRLAASRNVSYFYATDDKLPNPYDRLPQNWERQVDAVRAFNGQTGSVPEPSAWLMMIAGFGVVGASMRRRTLRSTGFAL
jgi:hypothetical protein